MKMMRLFGIAFLLAGFCLAVFRLVHANTQQRDDSLTNVYTDMVLNDLAADHAAPVQGVPTRRDRLFDLLTAFRGKAEHGVHPGLADPLLMLVGGVLLGLSNRKNGNGFEHVGPGDGSTRA